MGRFEKNYLSELPNFLYENWKWWLVVKAVLCNFVWLLRPSFACRSNSLSIIPVGIHVRAMLLGANCSLTYCQLALGKHSVEGHLLPFSSGKLSDFNAVNSCGIWEHLTPPEGHPAPWRIKPGSLTWIHTNRFQSLSWQMIAQMANNPCWLQLTTKRQAYRAFDHLLAALSSPLSVSSIHLLSSLVSIQWAPKGSGSTRYGLLCWNSPQR